MRTAVCSRNGIFFILILWLSTGCHSKRTELAWSRSLYLVGTQSSPRLTDLDGDGVLDVVIGAGAAEMAPTDMGVVALDGESGELLWHQKAPAHVVGSALFHDITEDGIEDVVIGGRGRFLAALNGSTGAFIWQYEYRDSLDPVLQYARYNFYNGTFVPDQDQNGHPELLIVNGGNWNAEPGDESERYPGVLMLIDVQSGKIVVADTMPDGKESYLSPVLFENRGELMIVFGSGGETISGHLYLVSLSDLINGDISGAQIMASETDHGFIAPPSLADLNQDGVKDIIAISHASRIIAMDGNTRQKLWEQTFAGMESSNAFAIGYFSGKPAPDVLTVMNEGVWPAYGKAQAVLLSGESGDILRIDSLGCFMVSSPVVYDLTGDGFDEAIFSTNGYDCDFRYSEDTLSPKTINHQLFALDFRHDRRQVIDESPGFKNIFSTPWIGDQDGDGYLDMIYCPNYNPNDLQKFLGMEVRRISTSIRMRKPVLWGEYMGQNGRGQFSP